MDKKLVLSGLVLIILFLLVGSVSANNPVGEKIKTLYKLCDFDSVDDGNPGGGGPYALSYCFEFKPNNIGEAGNSALRYDFGSGSGGNPGGGGMLIADISEDPLFVLKNKI